MDAKKLEELMGFSPGELEETYALPRTSPYDEFAGAYLQAN